MFGKRQRQRLRRPSGHENDRDKLDPYDDLSSFFSTHLSSWMACARTQRRPGALARPNDVSPRRRRRRADALYLSPSLFHAHSFSLARVRRSLGLESGSGLLSPRKPRVRDQLVGLTRSLARHRHKARKERSDTLRRTSILCCGQLAGVVLLVCYYGRLGYGITDRVTIRAVRDIYGTTKDYSYHVVPADLH